jgi:exodeoxyribonuclease V alpha subunit
MEMVMIKLDLDQQRVIDNFRSHNMQIISGSPGSGKTAIISYICDLLDTENIKYLLIAPTGKASKRMSELTKRPAKTIHRALKAGFGFWHFNENNKIYDINYVICDETSMLDLDVMHHLLQAFPVYTKFIFVGDVYQLPSVGPGSVLRDMVRSKLIPTYYLTYNHRQSKGSLIAHDATLINRGELKLTFGDDIKLVEADNPIDIRHEIEICIKELKADGYDLIADCQILTPQHSTMIGVTELNKMLRYLINDKAKPSEKFSIGDKVIQTVNNYQLKVFNGYIGKILGETYADYAIRFFDADDNTTAFKYPKSAWQELMLAYATTIHKFQGSETKAGILILSNSHHYMWNRNLLYTAITRFKEKCIIIGDLSTFKHAIQNNQEGTRYSKLCDRIRGIL